MVPTDLDFVGNCFERFNDFFSAKVRSPVMFSATRLASTSSDIGGAALIARLRLRGGVATPSWAVGVGCDCCEMTPVAYTHTRCLIRSVLYGHYSTLIPSLPYHMWYQAGPLRCHRKADIMLT